VHTSTRYDWKTIDEISSGGWWSWYRHKGESLECVRGERKRQEITKTKLNTSHELKDLENLHIMTRFPAQISQIPIFSLSTSLFSHALTRRLQFHHWITVSDTHKMATHTIRIPKLSPTVIHENDEWGLFLEASTGDVPVFFVLKMMDFTACEMLW
jgi:hypothetical protein